MNRCLVRKTAVILQCLPPKGCSTYSKAFALSGPGILSASELDAPGVAGSTGIQVTNLGGVSSGDSGGRIDATPQSGAGPTTPPVIATPALPPPGLAETKQPQDEKKGSAASAGSGIASPTGLVQSSELAGGLASTGASGGVGAKVGGCGASLNPNTTAKLDWIGFFLILTALAGFRFRVLAKS